MFCWHTNSSWKQYCVCVEDNLVRQVEGMQRKRYLNNLTPFNVICLALDPKFFPKHVAFVTFGKAMMSQARLVN